MRSEYASGSPKPPLNITPNSERSASDVNSLGRRDAKRVGVAVEVETAHGGEADALVEFGPRRSGEDLDAVAEVDQLARQVPGVDALAAAARVAPVDQEGDAVLARLGRPRRDVGRRDDGLGAGPGRLRLVDGLAQGTGQGATFGYRESSILAEYRRRATNVSRTTGFHREYIVGMDLTYPAETEPFRKEVRAWLEENLPDGWFDAGLLDDAPRSVAPSTPSWTEKLFAGGWICAGWPVEYGGKGLTLLQQVVLNEEFAKADAPMRADFFGDTLVGPTILQWGTDEQKREFIPGILQGKIAWCQGFSEPDAGSDLASLKTSAVLDGDEWVINGQKVWTSQAQHADYVFLMVRTDPDAPQHAGISYLLVPMHQDGRRGPSDRPGRRLGRLQRGLLHQRALFEEQRRRRRQQRLEGRDDDARLRARREFHDRVPAIPQGVGGDRRRRRRASARTTTDSCATDS